MQEIFYQLEHALFIGVYGSCKWYKYTGENSRRPGWRALLCLSV